MVKHHAIAIGINKYSYLPSLSYAHNDVALMTQVFQQELGFESVFTLTDGKVTEKEENFIIPTRTNILDICANLSDQIYCQTDDNIWLFFRGRGIQYQKNYYLMPIDGKNTDIENTGISLTEIIQYLQKLNPGNIILFLDIHDESLVSNHVNIYSDLQKNHENLTIFIANKFGGYSYDLPPLRLGIFTYVLAEALSKIGQCSSVAKLSQYLQYRVPVLAKQYHKKEQNSILFTSAYNQILLPQYTTKHDIYKQKSLLLNTEVQDEQEGIKDAYYQIVDTDGNDLEVFNAFRKKDNLDSHKFSITANSDIYTYPSTNILIHSEQKISTKEYSEIAVTNAITKNKTSQSRVDFSFNENLDINRKHYQNQNNNFKNIEYFASYQRLADLLKAKNWHKADKETAKLLLEISQQQREGWLNVTAINRLNPQILEAINQLWCEYSNNRFGFSIQKQIWESMGGTPDADYELWCEYCDRIGWQDNGDWHLYSDLTFDLTAPIGQFPAAGIVNVITHWQGWSVGTFSCLMAFSNLMYL